MMIVTLPQAKQHLRIDTDLEDADLTLKIHAASAAVVSYMNGSSIYEPELDVDGEPVLDEDDEPVYTTQVLFQVYAAVLLMLGYLYKDRDNDRDHEYEMGYLPRPVTALLYPLRDPALSVWMQDV